MALWIEFLRCVRQLRTACARQRTFLWLMVVLVAWAVRPDLMGVTSFVRASFLSGATYPLLLHFFHSNALNPDKLLELWVKLALTLFNPVCEGDRLVYVADGLKVAKEGRKMPAVKCLHQESENNSKAEFVMGHSFQVIALLVTCYTGQVFAVPLLSRICEGIKWRAERKPKTLLDKLAAMFLDVASIANRPAVLVADAYYASRTVILPLLQQGNHLITRARKNAVAYRPPKPPKTKRRGAPRKYGDKVKLKNLFKGHQAFQKAHSPVYDEDGVEIEYRSVDLLWRPVGQLVRFVLVRHPTRGRLMLLSTDLEMDPITIIKLYGYRFKIEVSFKQAIHTLGIYAYHFWMMSMDKVRWGSGNQDVSFRTADYRNAVIRKLAAYHRYVQIGCILQGLLQHLAINFQRAVWKSFRSWFRTMKTACVPSEMVVSHALRSRFPEFLLDKSSEPDIKKFIINNADPERLPGFYLAA